MSMQPAWLGWLIPPNKHVGVYYGVDCDEGVRHKRGYQGIRPREASIIVWCHYKKVLASIYFLESLYISIYIFHICIFFAFEYIARKMRFQSERETIIFSARLTIFLSLVNTVQQAGDTSPLSQTFPSSFDCNTIDRENPCTVFQAHYTTIRQSLY